MFKKKVIMKISRRKKDKQWLTEGVRESFEGNLKNIPVTKRGIN